MLGKYGRGAVFKNSQCVIMRFKSKGGEMKGKMTFPSLISGGLISNKSFYLNLCKDIMLHEIRKKYLRTEI